MNFLQDLALAREPHARRAEHDAVAAEHEPALRLASAASRRRRACPLSASSASPGKYWPTSLPMNSAAVPASRKSTMPVTTVRIWLRSSGAERDAEQAAEHEAGADAEVRVDRGVGVDVDAARGEDRQARGRR